MMYTRLVIGECIADAQVKDFDKILQDDLPELAQAPGFVSVSVDVEVGGAMVLIRTVWKTREDCIWYHSSRAYRQFVAKTQHLLVGDFVVKLFQETQRR